MLYLVPRYKALISRSSFVRVARSDPGSNHVTNCTVFLVRHIDDDHLLILHCGRDHTAWNCCADDAEESDKKEEKDDASKVEMKLVDA